MVKTCTACGVVKPLGQFRLRQGKCRLCQDAYQKVNYLKNREKILARMKTEEYREEQRERDKARYREQPERRKHAVEASTKYREKYPERRAATNSRWNAKPEAKVLNARRAAKRRAIKLQATPAWANHIRIDFIYASMQYLRGTGLDVHVDHIVPLLGRTVRGFHTHNNLQLMFATLNQRKHNKLI